MMEVCDRAFKEWAVVCEALKSGRQILLIRKGGIREDNGTFLMNDPQFLLMPTYEHQRANHLQAEFVPRLEEIQACPHDPNRLTIDSYVTVEHVAQAADDAQVNRLASEHIWNEECVRARFDFNPYDPLYLAILRVYRLPEPVVLPMRPEYGGCRSWITLEREIPIDRRLPVLSDDEFEQRKSRILASL